MRRPARALLGAVLCALLPGTAAFAQAEHVPAENPVYDFLDRMHTLGFADGFSRTVLPLDRADVTALLRGLDSARDRLSGADLALLARYDDEFVAEADGAQRPVVLFDSGEPLGATLLDSFSDREKFLYRWANADRSSTFFVEGIARLEYRAQLGGGTRENVWLGTIGGRFRGTVAGFVGYGLRGTNGMSQGNRALALEDPVLAQSENFNDLHKQYFDLTEAHVALRWSWGSASIGRERLLVGLGYGTRTLVSGYAPPFDALRLNVHVGAFRFTWAHGWLIAERDTSPVDGRPVYANKFIALHRAEADIARAVRFGVYESVVYSERDIDLAYLNPVNFYKSAEHAGGDRDNPMLGFDAQTLCIDGYAFYGAWNIDDVDFSKWGTGFWGNKFTWQGGVTAQKPIPGTEIGIEYSRIEPYTYTHFFRNNEYVNRDFAIGFSLPPNSDEWLVRVRHWIGAALVVNASVRYRRHGMNEYAPDGTLIRNHGGNVLERIQSLRDGTVARFLDGPRENQFLASFDARYEPIRNVVAEFSYGFRRTDSATAGVSRDHLLSLLLEIDY